MHACYLLAAADMALPNLLSFSLIHVPPWLCFVSPMLLYKGKGFLASFYMESRVLVGGAGHVPCNTSAVGSQLDGSSHTANHFHKKCSSGAFTLQPEGELLRVHKKCTQKIKVSPFPL
jgi:hypothetical protein